MIMSPPCVLTLALLLLLIASPATLAWNISCSSAIDIPVFVNDTYYGDTSTNGWLLSFGGSCQTGAATYSGSKAMVYRFQGQDAGVRISLCGSAIDTLLFLVKSLPGSDLCEECLFGEDDHLCLTNHEEVTWAVRQGFDYYVIVSGFNGVVGAFDLEVSWSTSEWCSGSPGFCSANPALECVDGFDGPACDCPHGTRLVGGLCSDVNECELPFFAPCGFGEVCSNTEGSFTCECGDGFESSSSSPGTCVDIDECEVGRVGELTCPLSCVNYDGSFYCACGPGYLWTGFTCVNINECEGPDGPSLCDEPAYTCTDTDGSFACENTNECFGPDPCPNEHDECTDTVGSFVCECWPGFVKDVWDTCINADECSDSSEACPLPTETCVDVYGSFECVCKDGFRVDMSGSCVNINECFDFADPCPNSYDACEDTFGSFLCECEVGFYQDSYGYCANVNECYTSVACPPSFLCEDVLGSFDCVCPSGFTDDGSGSCIDINECAQRPPPCGFDPPRTGCVNYEGYYECVCGGDYVSYGQNDCVFDCEPGFRADGVWPSTTCTMCLAGTASGPSPSLSCQPCVSGSVSDDGVAVCEECSAGYRAVNGTTCVPCPPGWGSDAGSEECFPCEAGSAGPGAAPCRLCEAGTAQNDTGQASCIDCVNAVSNEGAVECTNCTLGGTPSSDRDRCVALPGYVMVGENAFLACAGTSPADVCCGGETPMCGPCDDLSAPRAYEGDMCDSCADNYFDKEQNGVCVQCPALGWIYLVAMFGAIVLISIFMVATAKSASYYMTACLVALNFFQVISILATYDLRWPSIVVQAFNYLDVFSLNIDVISVECAFGNGGMSYTEKWAFKLLLPLMFAVILLLICVLAPLIIRIERSCFNFWCCCIVRYRARLAAQAPPRVVRPGALGPVPTLRRTAINAMISIFSIAYVMVVLTLLEVFDCETLTNIQAAAVASGGQASASASSSTAPSSANSDDSGSSSNAYLYMRTAPLIECASETSAGSPLWQALRKWAYAGLAVYGLGIPLAFVTALAVHRRVLHEEKTVRLLGLLYGKYVTTTYYWEIIILLRKLGISMGKWVSSGIYQLVFIAVIIFLSMVLQIRFAPYASSHANNLETVSVVFSGVILLAGLMFYLLNLSIISLPSQDLAITIGGYIVVGLIAFFSLVVIVAMFMDLLYLRKLKVRGIVNAFASERVVVHRHFFTSDLRLHCDIEEPVTTTNLLQGIHVAHPSLKPSAVELVYKFGLNVRGKPVPVESDVAEVLIQHDVTDRSYFINILVRQVGSYLLILKGGYRRVHLSTLERCARGEKAAKKAERDPTHRLRALLNYSTVVTAEGVTRTNRHIDISALSHRSICGVAYTPIHECLDVSGRYIFKILLPLATAARLRRLADEDGKPVKDDPVGKFVEINPKKKKKNVAMKGSRLFFCDVILEAPGTYGVVVMEKKSGRKTVVLLYQVGHFAYGSTPPPISDDVKTVCGWDNKRFGVSSSSSDSDSDSSSNGMAPSIDGLDRGSVDEGRSDRSDDKSVDLDNASVASMATSKGPQAIGSHVGSPRALAGSGASGLLRSASSVLVVMTSGTVVPVPELSSSDDDDDDDDEDDVANDNGAPRGNGGGEVLGQGKDDGGESGPATFVPGVGIQASLASPDAWDEEGEPMGDGRTSRTTSRAASRASVATTVRSSASVSEDGGKGEDDSDDDDDDDDDDDYEDTE